MMVNKKALAYSSAIGFLLCRVGVFLFTPLLLDSIMPTITINDSNYNCCDLPYVPLVHPAVPAWQKIDPWVQIVFSMGLYSVILGIILLVMILFVPGKITARERNFPKKYLIGAGLSQSVTSLLYQYSSPGERTAPYLQAFISNFSIPIMFILRWVMLMLFSAYCKLEERIFFSSYFKLIRINTK